MNTSNYEEKVAVLKKVKRYIDDHLDGSATGKSVAEHFGYPYMTFRRFVQEVGGFSIHAYIRLRRIQKAASLLRAGMSPTEAAKEIGFATLAGFNKAFFSIYGVTSSEYAETRGDCRMTEPELRELPGGFVVGYVFQAPDGLKEEDRGGYWIGQDFPYVDPEEFAKIGGGAESVAIWVEWDKKWYYVIGSPVEKVRYVPKLMKSHWVPGGLFLEFKAPPSANNTELSDNMRAVWWYALRQWLPESEYEQDETRLGFEFYLDEDSEVYVPVKLRIPPNEGL